MRRNRLDARIASVVLTCAAMMVACSGTSADAGWDAASQQATATVRSIAAPTSVSAIAQSQPTSTNTSKTQATPTANVTAAVNITATALPLQQSFLDKLPKDEKGRVIGGPIVPYLNYSPTMIMGKPCTRATKWTWKVVRLDPPLRPYGQADDPCIVQNAVDDFVRSEFANPGVNTPETMKAVEKVYASDPAIVDGLNPIIRDNQWQAYREGKIPYSECDKPRFKLLDVSPRTPLVANNDGTVTGQAIELTVFLVAQNVEPYTCQQRSYKDGSFVSTVRVAEVDLKGKHRVLKVGLLWNLSRQRWAVYDFHGVAIENYYTKAKELWDAAPIKP